MFSFLKHNDREFKKMKSALRRRYPLCSADIRTGCEPGKISVVLPVYNCEKYLEESVRSVLSQTYRNIELIIVDDGSTDQSGAIADKFMSEDERVKVIHQKNLKLPAALNNGFSVAKGEFFTWTSADNRMLPECLEILANELMCDRSCDMVFGNIRLIDQSGNTLRGYGWYEFPPMSGNVILPDSTRCLNTVANNTIGAAFLYRAGSARLLKEYSLYKYMLEDYDYFMRMNSLMSIRHILHKKPLYEYRMHPDSLTAHDSDLGITESRPELMELDRTRRSFYLKPLCFYADGNDERLINALSKSGRRITSLHTAERLSENNPMQIFYVNCENTAPTWEPPENIPKFIVTTSQTDGVFGYDVMICRNSSAINTADGWISLPENAIAPFIALRARNDLMYGYEESIHKLSL